MNIKHKTTRDKFDIRDVCNAVDALTNHKISSNIDNINTTLTLKIGRKSQKFLKVVGVKSQKYKLILYTIAVSFCKPLVPRGMMKIVP